MKYNDELEAAREFCNIGRRIRQNISAMKQQEPTVAQMKETKEYLQIETWKFVGVLATLAESILTEEYSLMNPVDVNSLCGGILKEWDLSDE